MKTRRIGQWLSHYGSLVILLLLCAYYSYATLSEQHPITPAAGEKLARRILREHSEPANVLIVVRDTSQDRQFAERVRQTLDGGGAHVIETVATNPLALRKRLEELGSSGQRVNVIVTHQPGSVWGPIRDQSLTRLARRFPNLKGIQVEIPRSYRWPTFLTRENLLNVINQNADVAIIAIGMTLVIITAGIDLSVGSLLALSSVTTAIAIQGWGGSDATWPILLAGALCAIAVCTACGVFNGILVTQFRVPAFVATLAMMMIARGIALISAVQYQKVLSGGTTEGTPEAIRIGANAFTWIGNGQLAGIPNPIWLMILLYVAAHVMMAHMSIGRYIYAVGGNPEAARLSGVPVTGVLILVYTLCGMAAGVAGVVDASRFAGGRPNAGELYELQVIAAVVVGGTSLAGGEGRILGTLIGALIIAVIQNGLNMAGVKSYEQKVVFGLLILGAVILDQLKTADWKRWWRRSAARQSVE